MLFLCYQICNQINQQKKMSWCAFLLISKIAAPSLMAWEDNLGRDYSEINPAGQSGKTIKENYLEDNSDGHVTIQEDNLGGQFVRTIQECIS